MPQAKHLIMPPLKEYRLTWSPLSVYSFLVRSILFHFFISFLYFISHPITYLSLQLLLFRSKTRADLPPARNPTCAPRLSVACRTAVATLLRHSNRNHTPPGTQRCHRSFAEPNHEITASALKSFIFSSDWPALWIIFRGSPAQCMATKGRITVELCMGKPMYGWCFTFEAQLGNPPEWLHSLVG